MGQSPGGGCIKPAFPAGSWQIYEKEMVLHGQNPAKDK